VNVPEMVHYSQYRVRPWQRGYQRSALGWPAVSAYGCRPRPTPNSVIHVEQRERHRLIAASPRLQSLPFNAFAAFAVLPIKRVVSGRDAVGLGIRMVIRDHIDRSESARSETAIGTCSAPASESLVQQPLKRRTQLIGWGRFGQHLPQTRRRLCPVGRIHVPFAWRLRTGQTADDEAAGMHRLRIE
jgi:hypothetical protein